MNYQQQKTPRDLTLRGSMRFKKRVFCSPCESTANRTTLNSTDYNGMNGAGLLCLKSARIQIIAPCYKSACRLFIYSKWITES